MAAPPLPGVFCVLCGPSRRPLRFKISFRKLRRLQISEKTRRRALESREHLFQPRIPEMLRDRLSQHSPKIRRNRQVASFIKLGLLQPGPRPIYPAALHRSSHDKHYVGMTVIGAAITVFAGRAAEL